MTYFTNTRSPPDLALLAIDIGYNDFYVWKALDKAYQPDVVLVHYNGSHPPDEDKVVKYHPFFCGGSTNYYGASILALYHLGRSKGYSLIYAEKTGTNLFFIRDDILRAKNLTFKNMNDVEKIYRYPAHGIRAQDRTGRPYMTSESLLK